LRDHEGEFRKLNVIIVVVTFENDFFARSYVEETNLDWPLLIDGSRETYASYGMLNASFLDIWGPRSWLAYMQEALKGRLPKSSQGDIFQRGGDVLIDPDGIVRLHHVGAGPADRPDVATILQKIDR
jgi:hypothetical protein